MSINLSFPPPYPQSSEKSSIPNNSNHSYKYTQQRVKCILFFITSIILIIGCTLGSFGVFLTYIVDVHSIALTLTILGGCIILLAIIGILGIKYEMNRMLLFYFYGNIFVIALMVLFSASAMFFQTSFESWISHHWSDSALEYLRAQPCCPTYVDTIYYLESLFFVIGILGFLSIGCLLVGCYFIIRLLTVPIVMKHMLWIVNCIFILVSSALILHSYILSKHEDMEAGNHWMAYVFMGIGTFVFIMAFFGLFGSRGKSRCFLLIHILGLGLSLILLIGFGVASFTMTTQLSQAYEKTGMNEIACSAHLTGCSNCTGHEICPGVYFSLKDKEWINCFSSFKNISNCNMGQVVIHSKKDQAFYKNNTAKCKKCPEWTEEEVENYIESELRFLGLIAFLVCFFLLIGLFGAMVLRRSLAGYQSETI